MNCFGAAEYGNWDGFILTCRKCGKEGDIVPIDYYGDGVYSRPTKITLELRCRCGYKYGATIYSK